MKTIYIRRCEIVVVKREVTTEHHVADDYVFKTVDMNTTIDQLAEIEKLLTAGDGETSIKIIDEDIDEVFNIHLVPTIDHIEG